MSFQPMKFRTYQWPHNPETIVVEYRRIWKEWSTPFAGNTIQDFGCGGRSVAGEGEFFGSNCTKGLPGFGEAAGGRKTRLLTLPNFSPFSARLISLGLTGQAEPNLLHYRFEFREENGSWDEDGAGIIGEEYTASEGENLWEIADRFQTTVGILLERNPEIRWPNWLEEGEKVLLP